MRSVVLLAPHAARDSMLPLEEREEDAHRSGVRLDEQAIPTEHVPGPATRRPWRAA